MSRHPYTHAADFIRALGPVNREGVVLSRSDAAQIRQGIAKALGTDDSITTCDCCGKSNLKCTVTIELDDGELVHYGQVCAQRNTGKDRKTINREIRDAKQAAIAAAQREFIATPEYQAERERFAIRPRNLLGMEAVEFIREARDAAWTVREQICARHGVGVWSLSI
ncbi:hypothetical protein GCM10027082_24140 [Comamonas humi]